MRVLIGDALHPSAEASLVQAGGDVRDRGERSLSAAVAQDNPHVLVVRSSLVTGAALVDAERLSLVVRAGAGVNTIDLDACSRRGVFVCNCPGRNAVAVAELTFALLLALDRQVVGAALDTRAGEWHKQPWASGAQGLCGRTFGVLGVGQVGLQVIRRAQAFGMQVVAWSRGLDAERAQSLGVVLGASPEAVASVSDVLSVHLALTPETRGLVGDAVLGALRPGATVINTARAEVIDEAALLSAVRERGIRAGLDVLTTDQRAPGSPLLASPGVLATPHLGASTAQAAEAVATEVVRIAERWRQRGEALNVVNRAPEKPGRWVLVVRHLDRVGVLAGVLDLLRSDGLNIREMDNVLLAGGEAAVARIEVGGAVGRDLQNAIAAVPDVIAVALSRV